jgi:hypothetical protein
LAKEAIKKPGTPHERDRIIIGNMHRATASNRVFLISGEDWLRTCYQIAERDYGGAFWDGVAFHPYQEEHNWFSPSEFEADVASMRAVTRDFGDDDAEVWNTELGWNTIPTQGHTQEQDCRNVVEVFVTAEASKILPDAGYDRTCWWVFSRPRSMWCWGLVESSLVRLKPFFSFRQMTHTLTGKRLSRRVIQGGASDDSVRVYEFEDPATLKRTWVCWKNGGMDSAAGVEVRVPTMTDRITAESLAYRDGRPPALAVKPGTDGWLSLSLDERPVFISEQDAAERPDLVVDSVRVIPANLRVGEHPTVRAWVRNRGTRATPQGYATRVLVTVDGDSVGGAEVSRGIAVGQTVPSELRLSRVPYGMSGPVLFAATVNPDQRYVELDVDNNTGYTQAVIE